jgi:hypothetical protein
MLANRVIYEFNKNAAEKVRAEFCNYKGHDILNLRVYFDAGDQEENWKPTKKGLALSVSLIPELKKAVDMASEEYERLIGGEDHPVTAIPAQ